MIVVESLKKQAKTVLENEKKLVKAVCHNYLKQPLFEESLQAVVIYHLQNFAKNYFNDVVLPLLKKQEGQIADLKNELVAIGKINKIHERDRDRHFKDYQKVIERKEELEGRLSEAVEKIQEMKGIVTLDDDDNEEDILISKKGVLAVLLKEGDKNETAS